MNLRYIPFLLLLCFLLPACGGKQGDGDDNDSIAVNDSDSILIDTVETDIYVDIPPKKADELFDDFVYAFMRNKKFQRSRIDFPLKNMVDGENEPISQHQWRHNTLYSDRELFMTVSTSRKAARVAKDTSINYVAVLEINPQTRTVKQYDFNRINSEWKLTEINNSDVCDIEEGNADFLDFYCQFSTSQEFRAQHIAPQINVHIRDTEMGEDIVGTIDAAQWHDFAPELPTDEVMVVRYGKNFKNSNQRIVNLSAPSGDAGITMTFKKKDDSWMLSEYEN